MADSSDGHIEVSLGGREQYVLEWLDFTVWGRRPSPPDANMVVVFRHASPPGTRRYATPWFSGWYAARRGDGQNAAAWPLVTYEVRGQSPDRTDVTLRFVESLRGYADRLAGELRDLWPACSDEARLARPPAEGEVIQLGPPASHR
ncbi:MAG TPA: hypothetical protein VFC51_02310 [Chloroflexota bacterium]|nr:hypothetical protein [Chloroflexota bacterium]